MDQSRFSNCSLSVWRSSGPQDLQGELKGGAMEARSVQIEGSVALPPKRDNVPGSVGLIM